MSNPLGSRLSWARDFAVIGAVTGFAAPAPYFWHDTEYLAACSGSGAVIGAVLGVATSRALLVWLSRWPFGVLLVLGLALGALWGGSTGFCGGALALDDAHAYVPLTPISAIAGAGAGMLQLGWFWLPYTLARAKGKSALAIVAAACVVSVALGFASLSIFHLIGKLA
jgi:hypothetical protein